MSIHRERPLPKWPPATTWSPITTLNVSQQPPRPPCINVSLQKPPRPEKANKTGYSFSHCVFPSQQVLQPRRIIDHSHKSQRSILPRLISHPMHQKHNKWFFWPREFMNCDSLTKWRSQWKRHWSIRFKWPPWMAHSLMMVMRLKTNESSRKLKLLPECRLWVVEVFHSDALLLFNCFLVSVSIG